jgi:gas vesicle protein
MKKLVSVFMLGAGIGCGAALYFAPSGRRMRSRLRQKALRGMACVQQSASEMRDEAEELIDEAFELARKGSAIIETQRSGIRAALHAGVRAYNKTVHA